MNIKFIIDCKKNLDNKIKYVAETFLQFLVKNYSGDNKDPIIITYSDNPSQNDPSDIVIYKDSFAEQYFGRREKYPLDRIKSFKWGNESIPILFYSLKDSKEFIKSSNNPPHVEIHLDIFASAFYFLSLWQEYVDDDRDVHNRFCGSDSIQKKLDKLTFPIVNVYFELLAYVLVQYYNYKRIGEKKFDGKSFAICMSHDIDYIKKWSPGIIYREVVKYLFMNGKEQSLRDRLKRFSLFLTSISKNKDPYKISINEILNIEMKNNLRSTFFFKTGGTSKHDISYNLNDKYVKNLIQYLIKNGFDVGLHPSYNAYDDVKMMTEEKNKLVENFQLELMGVREHFLRYNVIKTSQIQDKLKFIYDSSLGFHDYEGFRASYCFPYQIYDIPNDKKLHIWELPLVMMDATLTDYRKLDSLKSLEKISTLIKIIKKFNGMGVFLFHNTCFDDLDFKGWGEVFRHSIDIALKEGAYIGPLREILKHFISK